jgi:predicted GIY-YIG superfamily endonuclease
MNSPVISKSTEMAKELLPIKLNHSNLDDDTFEYIRNQLKEFTEESRPSVDCYAVYVLECQKPKLTQLVEEVNSEYSNGDMGREELIELIERKSGDLQTVVEGFKDMNSFPDTSDEVIDELVEREQSDHNPVDGIPWVKYVLEADIIYYVGYTSDLTKRISQHVRGNGAFFTKVSPPNSLEMVYWFDDQSEALEAEKEIAHFLTTLKSENRSTVNQELRKWNREGDRIFAKQS